ncbi:MAG: hypothetical protein GEV28_11730 [Actinophytocola sp.]|uniref:hypothetical protein n=1 Tax=Actinophytocola sp. TaxID=1872138 RepID=UPI0013248008|nr:hypothetical protein [Actinophytocola sp.]MPZ81023.1 hypothetical protein [Actinophytocola sp.]
MASIGVRVAAGSKAATHMPATGTDSCANCCGTVDAEERELMLGEDRVCQTGFAVAVCGEHGAAPAIPASDERRHDLRDVGDPVVAGWVAL